MKKTTIIIILFTLFLNTCNSDEVSVNIPPDAKVIIIGAGASGLYAGKILKDKNVDFTILEASGRIGGRLKKNTDFTDFSLDLGAEWIHGNQSLTYEWAVNQSIEIYEDESDGGIWYNNQSYTFGNIPPELLPIINYTSGGALSSPDESLKSWAIGQSYGVETFSFLEALCNGFGGSADLVSMPNVAAEEEKWTAGDNDYKFKNQTYFDLIYNAIVPDIMNNIILNSPVTKINYAGDKVIVTANGKNYEADRVIVTVSLKVLGSHLIEFIPPLPNSKLQAINKIGMDAGMKVYLKFNTNFFETGISGADISPLYYDAGYGKPSNKPTLGLFITGTNAQELSNMNESDAIQNIINELDIIHNGQASPNFTGEYIIQDWTKEPYILGAYSYATVGMGNARAVLAQPINNKVFFAGEATHLKGHNSTVHGALETGEREANNVINSF